MSNMKNAIADMFKPTTLRKAVQGQQHGVKAFFVRAIGGKAATAVDDYQQAIVGYKRLISEGESRKGFLLLALKQYRVPFAETNDGLWRVMNKQGVVETQFPGDVMENPSRYDLTPQQEAYVALNHKIIDDLVQEYIDAGGDPAILREWGVEFVGDHYFPRLVKSKDGLLLEGVYDREGKLLSEHDKGQTKRGLGSKQTFERARKHTSQASGQMAGVDYAHHHEAMEHFIDAMNYRIASIKTLEHLKSTGLGKTGKQLADFDDEAARTKLEEAQRNARVVEQGVNRGTNTQADLEAARKAAEEAQTTYDARQKTGPTAKRTFAAISIREARKEVRRIKSLVEAARQQVSRAGQGKNRPKSIVEVNHAADRDVEVRAAKKAYDEEIRRRPERIESPQSEEDARLEAAFAKALSDYEKVVAQSGSELRRTDRKLNEAILERQRLQDGLDELLLKRDALNVLPNAKERSKFEMSERVKKQRELIRQAESRVANLERKAKATPAPAVSKEDLQAGYERLSGERKAKYDELVRAQKALRKDTLASLRAEWQTKRAKARADIREATRDSRALNIDDAQKKLEALTAELERAQGELTETRKMGQRINRTSAKVVRNAATTPTESAYKFGLEGDIIKVRQVHGVPGLQGLVFPAYVADELERAFNERGIGEGYEWFKKGNDAARLFSASADFGYLFLQGLPVLATDPVAWGKALFRALEAFLAPEAFARWVAKESDLIREMTPYLNVFGGSDYFSAVGRGSFIEGLAKSEREGLAGMVQRGTGKGFRRFGVSFDSFLDAAKIYMWRGMVSGKNLTSAEKEAYARLLRNLTGTTDTARLGVGKAQREIESMLLFSPRFTRSVFALTAQAFEGGKAGWRARASIATLIGGAILLYAGIKTALHERGITDEPFSWEDLDPSQGGRFMSIKIGDNYYGIGGSMRGAIQMLGGAIMKPQTMASMDSGTNPFLKYARGRFSPAASNTANLITGETVIGEDLSDRKQWLLTLPDAYVPFGVRALVEGEGGVNQKFAAFGAQAVGGRSFPESTSEQLNEKLVSIIRSENITGFNARDRKEIKEWSHLTTQQKVNLLEAHPELRKELDARDAENWSAYKQAVMDADEAKRELGRRWALTQAQSGGKKMSADDLTSEEYRDELKNINLRLDAARNALRGADIVTGLGGDEFEPVVETHRQAIMRSYYAAIPEEQYKDASGRINWDKREALESAFLSSLSPDDLQIVLEETGGTSHDLVERKFKESKVVMRDYFDLNDVVAAEMGHTPLTIENSGNERLQKKYDKEVTRRKEAMRKANPELDRMLVLWGYVSVGINDRQTSRRSGDFKAFNSGRKVKFKSFPEGF